MTSQLLYGGGGCGRARDRVSLLLSHLASKIAETPNAGSKRGRVLKAAEQRDPRSASQVRLPEKLVGSSLGVGSIYGITNKHGEHGERKGMGKVQ